MIEDKTLFVVLGARDFTLCYDWISKVDFVDKLILRNYMHHDAHRLAQEYFWQHGYDYMIITSDDVLGTPDQVKMLLKDEEENKFPVVSGWCNVRLNYSWAAVSLKPHDGIVTRKTSLDAYHFIDMADIILAKYGYPYFKAWFVGLPLTLVTKEVLKQVPFKPFLKVHDKHCIDADSKLHGRGVMFDLQFACDCAEKKIPITIDSRIFLLHFGMTGSFVQVGTAQKSIEVIRATKT